MNPPLNLIGPQVRKLRSARGWSQAELARRLQLLGWSVSRHSVAKLELRTRRVSDCELLFFAKVLKTDPLVLLPRGVNFRELGPRFQSQHRNSIFPARGEK